MSNTRGRRPEEGTEQGTGNQLGGGSARAGGGRTTASVQRRHSEPPTATAVATDAAPGRLTMGDLAWAGTFALLDVQRAGAGDDLDDPARVQSIAAAGVAGAGGPLPHHDAIRRSFGPDHDVSRIEAHVGGPAAQASAAIGATAYATGNRVAFAAPPDLHTAAHEAAHVVQQSAGVHLAGGVGRAGDPYETHADAVANLVVAGQSAADLLRASPGGAGGGAGPTGASVQRQAGGHEGDETGIDPEGPLNTSDVHRAGAEADLKRAATEARSLEQHTTGDSIPLAAAMMTHIVGRATEAIQVLLGMAASQATADHTRKQWRSYLNLDSPTRQQTGAERRMREQWRRHLNQVARSAFAVMRQLGPEGGGPQVAGALASLGGAAAPLPWVLPESAEAATARARADEPCEGDATRGDDARDRDPVNCYFPQDDRKDHRIAIAFAARTISEAVGDVLDGQRKAIAQAMAADQKVQAMITELFIDALVTAATGGLGQRAGAGKAVAVVTTKATQSALRTVMTKIATDTVKTLVKKSRAVQETSTADDARVNTQAFADRLEDAAKEQLADVVFDVQTLPDHDLSVLAGVLSQMVESSAAIEDKIAKPLREILRAYHEQLAPAGQTEIKRPSPLTDPEGVIMPRQITKRIVRVITTVPGRPAFALVEVEGDVAPAIREAGRAMVGIAAVGQMRARGPRLTDTSDLTDINDWIVSPHIVIRFVRWIESPPGADFEAAVRSDAPEVPASRIGDLPLSTPHGTPAR